MKWIYHYHINKLH